ARRLQREVQLVHHLEQHLRDVALFHLQHPLLLAGQALLELLTVVVQGLKRPRQIVHSLARGLQLPAQSFIAIVLPRRLGAVRAARAIWIWLAGLRVVHWFHVSRIAGRIEASPVIDSQHVALAFLPCFGRPIGSFPGFFLLLLLHGTYLAQ